MENNISEYYDYYGDLKNGLIAAKHLGLIPSEIIVGPIDGLSFLEFAKDKGWELLHGSFSYKRSKFNNALYKINDRLYCRVDGDSRNENNDGLIFYFPEEDREKVNKQINFEQFVFKDSRSFIHLLVKSGHSQEFVPFKINPLALEIDKHYNDGFEEFDAKLVSLCSENSGGIVLLHGVPGTGKTTYIKHLASVVDRKFLYVTSGMGEWIGSSDFNNEMSNNKDAVLIIEDAEIALGAKSSFRSNATSNLLNITDGILADCFNTLVICTFNTNLANIDDALMRPGRLKAQYEFGKLSPEKVVQLTNGEKAEAQTLAEILKVNEYKGMVERKIGFVS